MLGKSWYETLNFESYPVPNKISRKANDINDLLEKFAGHKPAKNLLKHFNVMEIFDLYSLIQSNEIPKILNFIYDSVKANNIKKKEKEDEVGETDWGERSSMHSNSDLYVILQDFMFQQVMKNNSEIENDPRPGLLKQMLWDYSKMSQQLYRKINLNMKSYNRVKSEHNIVMILHRAKKTVDFKVHKQFPNVKSTAELDVELIKDKTRLVKESIDLHHCVSSYSADIKKGIKAIYSVLHIPTQKRYTLEMVAEKVVFGPDALDSKLITELQVVQFRGLTNSEPTKEVHKLTENLFTSAGAKYNVGKHLNYLENVPVQEIEVDVNLPF